MREEEQRNLSEFKPVVHAAKELPEEEVDPYLLGLLKGESRLKARQLVALVKQQRQAMQPSKPSAKLLASGGHILFLVAGTQSNVEVRLGLEHFVQPLRQRVDKLGPPPTIIVLCPQCPLDWESVASEIGVYFLKGSPLSDFDLDRANVRGAAAIFICNAGANDKRSGGSDEAWRVDAETVYCSRLVESRLPDESSRPTATPVITELIAASNHLFLPVPASRSAGLHRSEGLSELQKLGRSLSSKSFTIPRGCCSRICDRKQEAMQEAGEDTKHGPYFRSGRFASGQLFVLDVITSLVANTYYNPSLCDMVSTMIAADLHLVDLTPRWERKKYSDYFSYLLWAKQLLPIGILRLANTSKRKGSKRRTSQVSIISGTGAETEYAPSGTSRKFAFVYTAPNLKKTRLLPKDRILCFSVTRSKTHADD